MALAILKTPHRSSQPRPGFLMRPECVTMGGDLVVGALLSQIVYWSTRMEVFIDGVYWIAKTREQWIAETGLTLEQSIVHARRAAP